MRHGTLMLALVVGLGISGARGGVLDPRPEGPVACFVEEAFAGDDNGRFVTGLTTGGFVLGHRRLGSALTFASLFDRDGQQVGPEIVLDEPFVGEQIVVDTVTSSSTGNWLATWTGHGSPGTDNDLTSIKARLYNSAGTPLGDSFQVNSYESEVQARSAAAFLADGSFVVAFESDAPELFVNDVRARLFSGLGQPLGDDFVVTEKTEGVLPEVVALPDGGFVVLYAAQTEDLEPLGLSVRHYGRTGALLGDDLIQIVGGVEESIQEMKAEADLNGAVHVAAVVSQREGNLDRAITRLVYLKRQGDRFFQANSLDIASKSPISVNLDSTVLLGPAGLRTVVWNQNPTGLGEEHAALAWTFSKRYAPLSTPVQVNESLEQLRVGAALVEPNRAIVVWRATDGGCHLQGRFLGLPEPLFMDGFESGTTSAWSTTVE